MVKFLVNPNCMDMISTHDYNLTGLKPYDTKYLLHWEGDDGPVRYGLVCREFEKIFEVLMRPESLGPLEEVNEMGEFEKDLEKVSISKKIFEESEVMRNHFKKHR